MAGAHRTGRGPLAGGFRPGTPRHAVCRCQPCGVRPGQAAQGGRLSCARCGLLLERDSGSPHGRSADILWQPGVPARRAASGADRYRQDDGHVPPGRAERPGLPALRAGAGPQQCVCPVEPPGRPVPGQARTGLGDAAAGTVRRRRQPDAAVEPARPGRIDPADHPDRQLPLCPAAGRKP